MSSSKTKRAIVPAEDPAPKVNRAVTRSLAELRVAEFKYGKFTPYSNKLGGHFVNIETEGRRPEFRLVDAPEYVISPFEKGRYDNKEENSVSAASGETRKKDDEISLSLSNPQWVEDIRAIEDRIITHVYDNRADYLGAQYKENTKDQLKMLFTSKIKMPKTAGWSPRLVVSISQNYPPPIKLAKLTDANAIWYSKEKGSVNHLIAGVALVPTVQLSGGIWFVNNKFGIKWQLREAMIFLNRRQERESTLRLDHLEQVEEEPDPDPDGAPAPVIGDGEDTPFVDAKKAKTDDDYPNADYGDIPM